MKKTITNAMAIAGSLIISCVAVGYCLSAFKTNTGAHSENYSQKFYPVTQLIEKRNIGYNHDEDPELFQRMCQRADIVLENISDMERLAISDYIGPNNIVEFLKGKKFDAKTNELLKKHISLISGLIKKSRLEKDAYLYRGTGLECLNEILSPNDIERISNVASESDANDIIDKIKGNVFSSNKFFVSTSTSPQVAIGKIHQIGGVFIKINAKKGLNYLPIMQYCVWPEHEVLLDRNLKLKITNATFKLGQNEILQSIGPIISIPPTDRCLLLECETIV